MHWALQCPGLGCKSLPGFRALTVQTLVYGGCAVGCDAWTSAGCDDFEFGFTRDDGTECRAGLAEEAWAVPFEAGLPVRRFTSRKGSDT